MSTKAPVDRPNKQHDTSRAILRRLVQVVVQMLIVAATLFISSGRLGWVWAWAYLGIAIGILTVNMLILPPELIVERGQIREGTKGWDKALNAFIAVPTFATLIVAGLDERFGWTPQLSLALHLAALVLVTLGQGLVSWAMVSNKFFSTTACVQVDRGHAVASDGPYAYVRHPGYAGMIVTWLVAPLAFGSLWALISASLVAAGLIVRTAFEDRMLQAELGGYQDYATRVRYRLLPGVW